MKLRSLLAAGLAIASIAYAIAISLTPPERVVHAQGLGGEPWSCSLDAVGATLTQCKTNAGPQLKLYITDMVATSTTGTAGQFILRAGTGTNCGTGTVSVFPAAATAVRIPYPGFSAHPFTKTWETPVDVPAGKDLCILCIGTQLCVVDIRGYVAP